MKTKFRWFGPLFVLAMVLLAGECNSANGGPKELLDKFFSSAIIGDYATTYGCYYSAYQEKVSEEEYIRRRKEISALQGYKIVVLKQEGDTAYAEVQLTFGPSEKLKRKEPVTTTVMEDMVKERGEWKIKVW